MYRVVVLDVVPRVFAHLGEHKARRIARTYKTLGFVVKIEKEN